MGEEEIPKIALNLEKNTGMLKEGDKIRVEEFEAVIEKIGGEHIILFLIKDKERIIIGRGNSFKREISIGKEMENIEVKLAFPIFLGDEGYVSVTVEVAIVKEIGSRKSRIKKALSEILSR